MSIDLTPTIAAKSDQLNADDLLGRTLTIAITGVSRADGEQPISISYEGDNRKPYKPCKSMRRVLVSIWGTDGKGYVGRRMTLYRDPNVSFGGEKVGGIRISHMSDIAKETIVPLTVTRGQKRGFPVKPLRDEQPRQQSRPTQQQRQQQLSLEDRLREEARKGSPELKRARDALVRADHLDRADAIAAELDDLANEADARHEDDIDPSSRLAGTQPDLVDNDLPF